MQIALRFSPVAALAAAFLFVLLPHAADAATVTITMTDHQYSPKNVTINPGDTVKWVNAGQMEHTVTADTGSFDSGSISPGQSFSITFNQAGSHSYYCSFHGGVGGQGMAGTLTVAASNATSANANTSTYVNPNANLNNTNINIPTAYGTTNAQTSSSQAQLYAQAQALLAQVQALQAQFGGGGSITPQTISPTYDSTSCPLIGRSLKRGVSGDDVSRLQQFLARDPSVYPEAQVTGYFGVLTEAAVQRWQSKYNVVSSGTPATTGFGVVGPRTAAAIALLCTTGNQNTTPSTGGTPVVAGFIQVQPTTGQAPLTVNVAASINTARSCDAALYTLDFGDNTLVQQIPVSAGNCGQINQNFAHTYTYGGTYQIKLSSGQHLTTAVVTVSGSAAPSTTTPKLVDTMAGSPPLGQAPLLVTFTGITNAAGVCFGAPYSVVFGDGATASLTSASSTCQTSSFTITHQYMTAGSFVATLYNGSTVVKQVGLAVSASPNTATTTSTTPTGSMSAFVTSGQTPLNVTFYVSCASGVAYNVVFGDGQELGSSGVSNTSCGGLQSVSHTYTTPGTYTAQLVIFSQQSAGTFTPTAAGSVGITVLPSTNFSASVTSGQAPLAVNFTGTAAGTSYTLNFGDGTANQTSSCTNCTSNAINVSHTYSSVGTYTATLTGTDNNPRTQTITVSPSASVLVSPTTGQAPLQVSFSGNAPGSSYTLIFGDGSANQVGSCGSTCNSTPINGTHTYTIPGTYVAQLVNSNGTVVQSTTVTVSPAASLVASPATGQNPLTVNFSGTAAGSSYLLAFGDGTQFQSTPCTNSCTSSAVAVAHTYTNPGTYSAQLTGSGSLQVKTATVTVTAPPTPYVFNPPVVSTNGPKSFIVQYDLPTACTGYDLSWGDGTLHAIQNDGGSSCASNAVIHSEAHTYAAPGTYTMLLRRGATLSRVDDVSITVSQ